MRLRHIVLAALVAVNAFAAEVRLGPELPIVPVIRTGPAAYTQGGPSIASNGHDFLAMWSDGREGLRTSRYFTSRLAAAGEVVEPYGRRFEPSGFDARALI